ncbi:MAG TPA: hypothetical protein VLK89_03050, partial [Solirubrobacterales bacterium]|nr:hypothetical protein [Solirubrobacterales bacterium]
SQAADWAPCSSPRAYSGLAEGSHSFEVRAIDAAGNTDQTPATFSWSVDTVAPDTQITTHPSALTNSAAASFAFNGSDPGGSGIASFECRLDSSQAADWAPCSSPRAYSGLAEGSHSFEVRAIDAAGNTDQTPATFSWTVDTQPSDTQPPDTQITAHPAGLTNSTAASFVFNGTDPGGSGVASIQCRIDSSAPGAWAPCSSPKSYSGLADGAHTFEVRAIDAAANTDASPAAFTWTVDTQAPETQITTNPAALTNGTAASFAFNGNDGSGSGITSFECRIDSNQAADWAPCSSPREFTNLSEGSHTFEVRALDQAGNTDASPATFSWSVDTVAPDTQITTHPSTLTNSAAASFAFNGSDPSGSGIASFECRIDSSKAADWAPCSSPKSYSGLAEGAHAFEVRAVDVAANTDASPAVFTWTVKAQPADTQPPDTQITTHPSALTNSAAASFAFNGSDPGGSGIASFECRLDAGTWGPCSSPRNYANLSGGRHSFEVRAIDQAGNTDASPASFTWTIDTAAPDTQIITHPSTVTSSAAASFTFSGSDGLGSGVASFQCRLDSSKAADWAPCSSPRSYTKLSGGRHSFEVRAIDQAGNTDAAPASFSWTVDTAAPNTQIATHPATLVNRTSARFTFTGSDPGGSGVASFQCRLDSNKTADWATCKSPHRYTNLSGGTHTFQVRAIDAAGNADATPASFTWVVKTTKASVKSGPSSPARVTFVRTTYDTKKGTALLIFKVPGPGRLTASAPEVSLRKGKSKAGAGAAADSPELNVRQRGIRPQSIRVTRAGRAKLPIKLTPAGRKLLEENGKVKVAVLISFKAIDGSSATRKMTVTLRKKETPQK